MKNWEKGLISCLQALERLTTTELGRPIDLRSDILVDIVRSAIASEVKEAFDKVVVEKWEDDREGDDGVGSDNYRASVIGHNDAVYLFESKKKEYLERLENPNK